MAEAHFKYACALTASDPRNIKTKQRPRAKATVEDIEIKLEGNSKYGLHSTKQPSSNAHMCTCTLQRHMGAYIEADDHTLTHVHVSACARARTHTHLWQLRTLKPPTYTHKRGSHEARCLLGKLWEAGPEAGEAEKEDGHSSEAATLPAPTPPHPSPAIQVL